MPKLKHFDNLGTARFVTFSCYRRHRYLDNSFARKTVMAELSNLRMELDVKILGYVIMPEEHGEVVLEIDGYEI